MSAQEAPPTQPTTTAPPDPIEIGPGNDAPNNSVPGCPTGSYEGAFAWNEMRQLYICLLPFVEDFFTGVYGEGWQRPTATIYVGYDGTYPHGCRGREGDVPDFDLTVYAYCPADNAIYLGAGSMWRYYFYSGDIAPAVALAHEYGHYFQDLFIDNPEETQLERIAAENQSDCVGGAWVRYMEAAGWVESDDPLDVETLLRAIADAENDFEREHGTIGERTASYNTGFQQGIEACNDIYYPITGEEVVADEVGVTAEAPVVSVSTELSVNANGINDCGSGPVSEPCEHVLVSGVQPPAHASCEEAVRLESCAENLEAVFGRWGGNLPRLYGTEDRELTLGYFVTLPQFEVYGAALLACGLVDGHEDGPEAGQDAWFSNYHELWPDYPPAAYSLLFDSAMEHVCPDVAYTPVYDEDPGQTTTTTGSVTQTAGATALIDAIDASGNTVQQAYTCSDIAFPLLFENANPSDDIESSTVCTAEQEDVFRTLVETMPTGFDVYVSSGEIGVFGGADIDAPTRASFGWWACFGATDNWDVMHYTTEMQRFFSNSSSMDTNAAWEAAFRYICPGMRPAV